MSFQTIFQIVAGWLIFINAATFLTVVWDKHRAVHGRRRVPEMAFYQLAAIGGGPGGLLAMHLVRHKTYKQPFRRKFLDALTTQVVLTVGIAIFWLVARAT